MAAYTEFFMDAGADFSKTIYLSSDVTNSNINVAGYTITSSMRRSVYAANATANLVCTITDSANGEITLTLPAANTINISSGNYLFDVKMIDTSNNTSRILEGLIIVTGAITI